MEFLRVLFEVLSEVIKLSVSAVAYAFSLGRYTVKTVPFPF